MDIKVRFATSEDRKELLKWYTNFKGIGLPLVAFRDEQLLASGFLIPSYFELCLFEFIKANPDVSMFIRAKAVKRLISAAIEIAKSDGYGILMGFVEPENKNVQKEFKRQGCIVSDASFHSVTRRL